MVASALCAAAPPGHETGPVPNEPYRHVPPGLDATLAATTARVVLATTAGRTTRGLIATSAEHGPQVSMFVQPSAFVIKGAPPGGVVVVEATPVALAGAAIKGRQVSNVYALRARSTAGPVALTPGVQPLTVSLRGFETELSLCPDEAAVWATLPGVANSIGTLTLNSDTITGNNANTTQARLRKWMNTRIAIAPSEYHAAVS